MANIRDCAKSLSYLRPLKEGGYISERDHDRIVGRVRRDLAKAGGARALEAEGRRKRMADGVAPVSILRVTATVIVPRIPTMILIRCMTRNHSTGIREQAITE